MPLNWTTGMTEANVTYSRIRLSCYAPGDRAVLLKFLAELGVIPRLRKALNVKVGPVRLTGAIVAANEVAHMHLQNNHIIGEKDSDVGCQKRLGIIHNILYNTDLSQGSWWRKYEIHPVIDSEPSSVMQHVERRRLDVRDIARRVDLGMR